VRDADAITPEVRDVVDLARRLWDSWEDDAVIRDTATGRYLDPDKVHHVRFEGEFFDVDGPLITPRSPQGQIVVRFTPASAEEFGDLIDRVAPALAEAGALRRPEPGRTLRENLGLDRPVSRYAVTAQN
jgi:alkanesulfonate monooxygenase SsuD/methylene tetrahydromethanopterin reductase-like flavin-dependent oxidoreductase (luciferase family)